MVTDKQVRKLFQEFVKCSHIERASMKANMGRNTGAKYLKKKELPSKLKGERDWRTHEDAFGTILDEVKVFLKVAPEIEAKTLFEYFQSLHPDKFEEGQLRTFQRRVRALRAMEGKDKEVFFGQKHRPGEAMEWDFTDADGFNVTIGGEPFEHRLFHAVLPYSNWESANVSRSESALAIRAGFNHTFERLQHTPEWSQSDNSSAATHWLGKEKGSDRVFNPEYEEMVKHYGMKPRVIGIGESEQNGDVESMHNALKNRIRQLLLLRGSRDFESEKAYGEWLDWVTDKANRTRRTRVEEEIRHLKPLQVGLLNEYREERVPVKSGSTIRVMGNVYSVPSRLIGEEVRVHIFDDRLEVMYKGVTQLVMERLIGKGHADINYRHVINSLVRKPGAFARYCYREELFPSLTFRQAFDRLCETGERYHAEKSYLRILKLAADTMESDVEAALSLLLEGGGVFSYEDVQTLVGSAKPEVPHIARFSVRLVDYDVLLGREVAL
jgi:transposase